MSFLTPLYLAGALAVALPILFHLIRRTPQGRVPFSTLMFLRPSPPSITKKRRLEHLLLLFLRALAVCLLAMAFSRPFLREVFSRPSAAASTRTVLLVDTSASMRRQGLWDEALAQANEVLEQSSPTDEFAVMTFDEHANSLIDFEGWSSLPHAERSAQARRQLAEHEPGWKAGNLGRALIAAAEALALDSRAAAGAPRQKRITLVSDLQAGSPLSALQRYAWPEEVELEIRRVKTAKTTNAGIQPVRSLDSGTDSKSQDDAHRGFVRIRVANAADSTRDNFEIGWAVAGTADPTAEPQHRQNVYVPRGRSRVVRIPVPTDLPENSYLVLRGDDHDFDNAAYVELPPPLQRTIVYIGDEPADDPSSCRFFVERAFPDDVRRKVRVIAQAPNAASPSISLDEADLVIVLDTLSSERLPRVQQFVQEGGTLVYVLSAKADPASVAAFFDGRDILTGEAGIDGFTLLEGLDFRHPVLAPFADARFADFTGIHFWKHRQVKLDLIPEHRLLARFENGDPAIAEIPQGEGRVFLFTTGWHAEDSQLALTSKFVPLLNGILEYADVQPLHSYHLAVGEALRLPSPLETAARVQLPDDSHVELSPGASQFARTELPGIYTLLRETAERFAVNVAAAESDTAPLESRQLEALGVTLHLASANLPPEIAQQRKQQAQARELEDRQRIWKALLLAGLLILVLETWLAGRVARRIATSEG